MHQFVGPTGISHGLIQLVILISYKAMKKIVSAKLCTFFLLSYVPDSLIGILFGPQLFSLLKPSNRYSRNPGWKRALQKSTEAKYIKVY